MKEEIKILMDEKRVLYIRDSKGIEYNFWPQGWGIPVHFAIKTEAEQEEDDRRSKETLKRELEREREIAEKYDRKPWYKKIFD